MSTINSLLQNNESLNFKEMQANWNLMKKSKNIDYQFYEIIFSSTNPEDTFKKIAGPDGILTKEDIYRLAGADEKTYKISNEDLKSLGIEKTDAFYIGLDQKENKLITATEAKQKVETLTNEALNELKNEKAKFGSGFFKYKGAAKSKLTDYQALDLMDGKLDDKINLLIQQSNNPNQKAAYSFKMNNASLVKIAWNNHNFNDITSIKESLIHESVHARDNDNKISLIEELHGLEYGYNRMQDDKRAPIVKEGMNEYKYKSLVFEQIVATVGATATVVLTITEGI